MRLFRPERIAGVMDRLGVQEGEVITHSLVTKSHLSARSRKVEAYNFEIRKRLIDYDDVMNKQREVIYGRRDEAMEADDLHRDRLSLMIEDYRRVSAVEQYIDPGRTAGKLAAGRVRSAQLEQAFSFHAFRHCPRSPSVEEIIPSRN